MSIDGIDTDSLKKLLSVNRAGQTLRLVATAAKLHTGRVAANVRLEWLNDFHPLVNIGSEWNALAITLVSGETIVVRGRGAGRWPTTEAVVADLFELRRKTQF